MQMWWDPSLLRRCLMTFCFTAASETISLRCCYHLLWHPGYPSGRLAAQGFWYVIWAKGLRYFEMRRACWSVRSSSGPGYERPDGGRERSHISGALEGAWRPAAAAGQSGRVQRAGLRLQSHHSDPAQDRGQSASHRVQWSTGQKYCTNLNMWGNGRGAKCRRFFPYSSLCSGRWCPTWSKVVAPTLIPRPSVGCTVTLKRATCCWRC